jgi:desulfoferrodoxin-like iron-binding protein
MNSESHKLQIEVAAFNRQRGDLLFMGKEGGLYVCDICQQVVRVVKYGAGTLVCCNQPMRLFEDD